MFQLYILKLFHCSINNKTVKLDEQLNQQRSEINRHDLIEDSSPAYMKSTPAISVDTSGAMEDLHQVIKNACILNQKIHEGL